MNRRLALCFRACGKSLASDFPQAAQTGTTVHGVAPQLTSNETLEIQPVDLNVLNTTTIIISKHISGTLGIHDMGTAFGVLLYRKSRTYALSSAPTYLVVLPR
jgi:hypothetical protein